MWSTSCAPGDQEGVVDHERRHTADAAFTREPLVLDHVVDVAVRVEHGRCGVDVEPGLGDRGEQRLVGRQVGAVGEVRTEEHVHQSGLLVEVALVRRPGDEPMTVRGVHEPGAVEAVLDAVGGAECDEPLGHAVEAARPVTTVDHLTQISWRGRGARIELVRPPVHLDVVAADDVEGGVEAGGAQVAPGADQIGPDVDAHAVANPLRTARLPGERSARTVRRACSLGSPS